MTKLQLEEKGNFVDKKEEVCHFFRVRINHHLYRPLVRLALGIKMVESKSKNDTITAPPTGNISKLYDIVDENFVKSIDEVAKVQPRYVQAIHNLILNYIHTVKYVIHSSILAQKQLASIWNVPIVYTEQFGKRSQELGENTMSVIDVNNDIAVKSLDAIAENLKVFHRAIDSFAEYTTNACQAWNSFYAVQRRPLKQ